MLAEYLNLSHQAACHKAFVKLLVGNWQESQKCPVCAGPYPRGPLEQVSLAQKMEGVGDWEG